MPFSARSLWHWLLAIFFLVAGANHFINPKPYLAMMPSWLPWPAELVWVSGVTEMLGGFGVLFARTRVVAGWGLIALLIAVFPANVHVAIHGWPEANLPQWILWLRLPFQPLLIWWVARVCLSKNARQRRKTISLGIIF